MENKDKMSMEINKRFFEALEYVRSTGKIRALERSAENII